MLESRHTLSPQMVLLDHVRRLRRSLRIACQVGVSCITLKNLILGKKPVILIFGVCKRNDDEFSRYGEGGVEVIVYAMTLLQLIFQQDKYGRRNETARVPRVNNIFFSCI